MSNDMVVFQENNGLELAPEFMPLVAGGIEDDLSSGVGGGFAVISIRSSKFRIKHRGEEIPITDEKGDPVGSIEAVIVRANARITKQYYEKAYDEGDSEAPTCFSLDGVKPAPTLKHPQSRSCATCPKDAFGSAPTRNGQPSKGKACSDNRKLAIVPLDDIDNEQFGGPMLLRVSATALQDLAQFGAAWKARGYPYNSIGVRIGTDMSVSYPKLTFKAIRPLTSAEANKVLALVHSTQVEKILVDFDPAAAAPQQVDDGPTFEQPPPAAPAPTPPPPPAAPKQTFIPKAEATPPPPPASAKATFGKAKVQQDPPAPAAPPAKKATLGKDKAAAPKPTAPEPAREAKEAAAPADPTAGGSLDDDINSILADLNSVAS